MFLSTAGLFQKGPGTVRLSSSTRLNSITRPMSGTITISAARLRRITAFHPWKSERVTATPPLVLLAGWFLEFSAAHKGKIVSAQNAAVRILSPKYFEARVFRHKEMRAV